MDLTQRRVHGSTLVQPIGNFMRRLLLATALCLAAPAAAQDLTNVTIKVERIAPGVAVLFGAGGNIALSYGADGNLIVDDQFAPLSDRIVAAIAIVDPDPVRFVINTHWHYDHTGGNENFGKRGSVIVAHDNVRTRMAAGQLLRGSPIAPAPGVALPVVTFGDGVTMHVNGDDIHVEHVANGHTDGDSLVHWRKANVLHTGDTFVRTGYPFIDRESGGSIDGLIAAATRGLAFANATTRVIPGHGEVASRTDYAAYRAMLVDVRAKVAAGIAARRTKAQIVATKPMARYPKPEGFIKADDFVGAVYDSLRSPPPKVAPHRH